MTVLYSRFQEQLLLEQGHLVASNTHDLAETVKEKERIAERIQSAEDERLALMAAIALQMNANVRALKVDEIAARLDKPISDALLTAKTALKAKLAQVKALNDINNQLLTDSMAYVKNALEVVTGKQNVRQGYSKGGQIRTTVNFKRNLVNTRA